jgi:DNA-binding CsgD family transcriptional regulator
MRQRLSFVLSTGGEIIAANNLSAGAIRAGMTIDDVLGQKWWSWHTPENQELLKAALADILLHDDPVEFEMSSVTNGNVEHWHMRLTLIRSPLRSILCMATQRFDGANVTLTSQQRQMLDLLASDLSVAEVAKAMDVTENALHHRLGTLRKKFGVHTNHGLMVAAGRHGLLMDS